MPSLTLAGLFGRLRPAGDPDSDADLLGRFVDQRDAGAFGEIVRRHGAMVLAVCRRVLGDGPDAEDAHQIAFMALARDAGRIATPSALGGWLYRVAWLSARKLAGRVHRRKPEPLTTDPAIKMPPAHENDLKAVIDEELLALSERFRAVAVLCLVEGRTNTEAAGLLGIPKGTVDSRLSTAKAKLRERLLRRGIAAAAVLTVDQLLTSETLAASGRAATLATDLVTVALDYAAGVPTAGSEHLIHTANGVRTVSNNLKWLAAVLFTSAVLTGGGAGVYMATAGEKDKPAAEKPADPKQPPKPTDPPKADKPGELTTDKPRTKPGKASDEVQSLLDQRFGSVKFNGGKFGDLMNDGLFAQQGLNVRLDTPAFVRRGWTVDEIEQLRQKELKLDLSESISNADLLREALGQVSSGLVGGDGPRRLGYRIKGNAVLIVPEYQPSSLPGSGANGDPVTSAVPMNQLMEDLYGEPVTVRYKKKPLSEVIEDLQDRTGANIVLNVSRLGEADPEKMLVTANFNDARLLTVLKIVGDMNSLKPVVVDNVFYLTDATSAEEMQKEVNRDLFGTPAPPAKPEKK